MTYDSNLSKANYFTFLACDKFGSKFSHNTFLDCPATLNDYLTDCGQNFSKSRQITCCKGEV